METRGRCDKRGLLGATGGGGVTTLAHGDLAGPRGPGDWFCAGFSSGRERGRKAQPLGSAGLTRKDCPTCLEQEAGPLRAVSAWAQVAPCSQVEGSQRGTAGEPLCPGVALPASQPSHGAAHEPAVLCTRSLLMVTAPALCPAMCLFISSSSVLTAVPPGHVTWCRQAPVFPSVKWG